MDGHRDDGGRLYGPPRITLIPPQDVGELPALHTNRETRQTSKFHFIQPSEEWYSPARSDAPQQLDRAERKRQKRWIHGTRPEAITGVPSEILSDLLFEQDAAAPTVGHRPLLAIGQMTDMTRARMPKPKALLATAAGSSGELLRLTALRRTVWQWGEHPDPTMRMLHADHGDAEDVALWSLDDSPITQIKVALSLAKQEPSRYVIVQKKLCTTLLRPLYRRLPVPGTTQGLGGGNLERPSRIDPRPMVTISSEQTGGRSHVDVAFNPGSSGRPEQLAIVDDGGCWTVWNMEGKTKIGVLDLEPRLRYRGHIRDGISESLFRGAGPSPAPHGILWVGPAGADKNSWDAALDQLEESQLGTLGHHAFWSARSRTLLVWNATHLVLVNLQSSMSQDHALQLLKTLSDRILHVEMNPANRCQAFVLTSTTLFWLDFGTQTSKTAAGVPIVLLSCAHLRGKEGEPLALRANLGWPELGGDAAIVSLFSRQSAELDIFIFNMNEQEMPHFRHHTVRVPNERRGTANPGPSMQTMCLAPASMLAEVPGGLGAASLKRDDRFWQLFMLDETLGLRCSLVTATSANIDDVDVPDTCPEMALRKQRRAQKRRRVDAIKKLAETFVVPDSFGDLDGLMRRRQIKPGRANSDGSDGEFESLPPRWPRRWAEGISLLASRVGISIESVALETEHVRSGASEDAFSSVELVQRALVGPLEDPGEMVALRTLRDYGAPFEAPPTDEQTETAWDMQFQELIQSDNQRIVVEAVISSFLGMEINTTTSLRSIVQQIGQIWSSQHVSATARLSRELALAEVSEAAMRSLYGLVVFDAETANTFDGLRSWVPEPDPSERVKALQSQRSAYLTPRATQSLSPGPPSGRSSRAGSSQPSRSSSQDPASTGALQRLSLLAAGLNTLTKPAGRQHPILAYWPATRGVPLADYHSSVAEASTQRVVEARVKAQRSEPRRRQKRPRITTESDMGMMPGSSQTLPPLPPVIVAAPVPQTVMSDAPRIGVGGFSSPRRPEPFLTSQHVPTSSQAMGLGIMSQPVPGQHGQRAAARTKKKRKGGF